MSGLVIRVGLGLGYELVSGNQAIFFYFKYKLLMEVTEHLCFDCFSVTKQIIESIYTNARCDFVTLFEMQAVADHNRSQQKATSTRDGNEWTLVPSASCMAHTGCWVVGDGTFIIRPLFPL